MAPANRLDFAAVNVYARPTKLFALCFGITKAVALGWLRCGLWLRHVAGQLGVTAIEMRP